MASIAKRKNGKWLARYRDEAGKEFSRQFDRKIDGQRWLDEVTTSIVTGTYVDPRAGRTTFQEYATDWLAMQPRRPSTLIRYEQALRRNIYPRIGDRPLASVRPSHIQALAAELTNRLSPSSARFNVVVASSIFKAAVMDRRLPINPCVGIKLPEVVKEQIEIITTAQVMEIQMAAPPEWQAIVTLGAGAGLRQGEALGVTQDRINFLKRQLRIDRQAMNLPGESAHLAPVKTKASNRTVPLPQVVVDGLAAHLAEFPTEGLIFPLASRQAFGRMWRGTVKRAGLPGLGFHALRHYYASLLIRHGESVKTVQARLGHASAAETLDTYSHLWPDSDDRTRAAVDDVLGAAADQLRTSRDAAR